MTLDTGVSHQGDYWHVFLHGLVVGLFKDQRSAEEHLEWRLRLERLHEQQDARAAMERPAND